ncbi:MAG: FG-GAP repeat protein [Phycisphaerales bacterium]|nr:FG-GAP repeat protein [Phycisphaerales bacterium]
MNVKLSGPLMTTFTLITCIATTLARGQPCLTAESEELVASDAAIRDGFSEVAIHGNTAVVGAFNQDNPGNKMGYGKAYVYEFDGVFWTQVAELTPSDPEVDKEFGSTVDIDGETIVIGAAQDGGGSANGPGAAYVFVRPIGGWTSMTETAKLTASDAAAADVFARVAINGDIIVVGALNNDDAGNNSGSAYVFEKPTGGWATSTETQKLVASDAAAEDRFGREVAIDGDTLVIGADQNNTGPGVAYVFQNVMGTWTEVAKLIGSDSANEDRFGLAVDIKGATICVGAFRHDGINVNAGAAYVYEMPVGGWDSVASPISETKKLVVSDAQAGENVGLSVAVASDQNSIFVGAYAEESAGGSGRAFGFLRPLGGWSAAGSPQSESVELQPSDRMSDDRIGTSIDVDERYVLVGASRHSHLGINQSGGAWVFSFLTDCDQDGEFDACEAFADCQPNGIPDACELEGNDCNNNGTPDDCELDTDRDGIPDDCDEDDDNDGVPDVADVCPVNAVGLPVDCDGRALRDCNGDCEVNALDLQCIVNELLGN